MVSSQAQNGANQRPQNLLGQDQQNEAEDAGKNSAGAVE